MGGMLAARTKKRCTPDRLSSPQLSMRHRWYDATLQRFISRDPIGLEGGANLYEYAENNPSAWVDPVGLKPEIHLYMNRKIYDSGDFRGYGAELSKQLGFKVQVHRKVLPESLMGRRGQRFNVLIREQPGHFEKNPDALGNTPDGGPVIDLYPEKIREWVRDGQSLDECPTKLRENILRYQREKKIPYSQAREEILRWVYRNTVSHELGHAFTKLGHGDSEMIDKDYSIMDERSPLLYEYQSKYMPIPRWIKQRFLLRTR